MKEVRDARQRGETERHRPTKVSTLETGGTGEQQPTGQPTRRTPPERAAAERAGTGDPAGRAEGADVSGRGVRSVPMGDTAVGGAGDSRAGDGDETVDTETSDELPADDAGRPGGIDRPDTTTEEGRDTPTGDTSVDRGDTESTRERSRPATRPEQQPTTEDSVEEDADAIFRTHVPEAATMPENAKPHQGELDELVVMADVPYRSYR